MESEERLFWLASELLRWNAKLNLTAIVDPIDVLDKHILDSLAVAPALSSEARTLLDAGTGAGFPGLPLALVRPDLEAWLVDAAAKKIGFVKHAIAGLQLFPRVKAVHATLRGHRGEEGIPEVDAAVSRAFREPARWAELAGHYLRPGGQLLVMAGGTPSAPVLDGWLGPEVRRFDLPGGDGRAVLSYRRALP